MGIYYYKKDNLESSDYCKGKEIGISYAQQNGEVKANKY